ncbi:MAG: nucleoside hydrolase [Bacteroidales bacterium]|nr:nucleoside hydrolase [Lachnospiraceae bacterium]MBQ8812824.1 nucleoside hydrolase [Bacteroidales bacterium]
MTTAELLRKLERPTGKVDVILDTDTYNEIDDQFALSYMIKSDDKLNVKAIYAAPYFNDKSTGPADGMEKSYQEILKVLGLLEREDLKAFAFRGSDRYLSSETEPVISDAAKDLAERAMTYTEENPLYVVAIGAITNVASALIMKPEIKDRMVVVWLGGHAHHWPENTEFNLHQDIAAARVIFGCGVPFVQLPCMGVVSGFTVSDADLENHLKGRNPLCDYLVENTVEEVKHYVDSPVWSRVIWDVTAVAWLLSEEFMSDVIVHSPIPEYDGRYAFDDRRHFMKYVYYIDRDKLLRDLFSKLTK